LFGKFIFHLLLRAAEDFQRSGEEIPDRNGSAEIRNPLQDLAETTLCGFFCTFANRARLNRPFEQLLELGLNVLLQQSIKLTAAALARAFLQQLTKHATTAIRCCRCTKRQKGSGELERRNRRWRRRHDRRRRGDYWWRW